MSSEKIMNYRAVFILEIIGKPKEHLVKTLEDLINQMASEKDVIVEDKKINEPKELEKKPGFFSTYAEIEIKTDNPLILALLMFKYMPSHVEIVSPEKIPLKNSDFSEILSEITRRLHSYEELVRVLKIEKQMLEKKVKESEEK